MRAAEHCKLKCYAAYALCTQGEQASRGQPERKLDGKTMFTAHRTQQSFAIQYIIILQHADQSRI